MGHVSYIMGRSQPKLMTLLDFPFINQVSMFIADMLQYPLVLADAIRPVFLSSGFEC